MKYSDFLISNSARISSIESTLRSLTWFLPGRFQDAELASEALYSSLNVLGLYHDQILIRAANTLPKYLKPPSSSHARYTKAWIEQSASYRTAARLISVLSYTELLIEMIAARRLGSEKRWRVVLALECFKAALRLRIVAATRRMVVHPPTTEREIDPQVLDRHRPAVRGRPPNAALDRPLAGDGADTALISLDEAGSSRSSTPDHWTGARTGLERPTIASLRARARSPNVDAMEALGNGHVPGDARKEVNEYLLSKVLTVEEVRKPEDLVKRLDSRTAMLAEIVWVLRPVIYVLAIRRYGYRHTAPFLLSLALEYLARSLRQTSQRSPFGMGSPGHLSEVEKNEVARRQRAFWWYLLRGPVWEGWTKPQIEGMTNALQGKPIIGLFAAILKDYTPLIDSYFYYSH